MLILSPNRTNSWNRGLF